MEEGAKLLKISETSDLKPAQDIHPVVTTPQLTTSSSQSRNYALLRPLDLDKMNANDMRKTLEILTSNRVFHPVDLPALVPLADDHPILVAGATYAQKPGEVVTKDPSHLPKIENTQASVLAKQRESV